MMLAGLVLGVALSGLAAASPTPAHPVTAEEFMRLADLDGDGRVSLKEWQADTWRVHQEQWGPAVDGGIPTTAVVAALCRMSHQDPGCTYGARLNTIILDRNHDGFVDRRESDQNTIGLFRQNDVNHDGYVTAAEIDAVASRSTPK